MISIVWKSKGVTSNSFRHNLKNYIRLHNPSIVCLLEPRVSGNQANKICSSIGFDEWIRVEVVGFSGGIWILWKATVNVNIISTHPQFINLQVDDNGSEPWLMTIVYGCPNLSL